VLDVKLSNKGDTLGRGQVSACVNIVNVKYKKLLTTDLVAITLNPLTNNLTLNS
jgi:hypothetical protein